MKEYVSVIHQSKWFDNKTFLKFLSYIKIQTFSFFFFFYVIKMPNSKTFDQIVNYKSKGVIVKVFV